MMLNSCSMGQMEFEHRSSKKRLILYSSFDSQINEIVTTGKLSKLEHFENDEKVT